MLVFATIVVVLAASLVAFQRKLIYLPSSGPLPPVAEVLPGGREVTLTTSDGLRLGAWFVRPDDARASVLVAPGNGGDRALRAPLARALAEHGLSVLLLDYRGYGGNPGAPTEEGLARDVRAARAFLTRETPSTPLIYFGESLGAAVVTELATEHPPAALVLRSPFTDLAAVGEKHYPFLPVRWLLRDEYPVIERVPRVRAPVTVVFGTEDEIVPPEQSRAVAEAAGATPVAVPGASHNDPVLLDGAPVVRAVLSAAPGTANRGNRPPSNGRRGPRQQ